MSAAGSKKTKKQTRVIEQGQEPEPPIIKMTNGIILKAFSRCATVVRMRAECGALIVSEGYKEGEKPWRMRETDALNGRLAPSIISRIKIMANMSISRRNELQVGELKQNYGGGDITIRVVVAPYDDSEEVILGLPSHG